jgi:predicted outer membrane repeat protein
MYNHYVSWDPRILAACVEHADNLLLVCSIGGSCSFSGNGGNVGGALYIGDGASMELAESVSFSNNIASLNGGAILSTPNSSILISGSNVSFAGNAARYGGQGSFYGKVAIQVSESHCIGSEHPDNGPFLGP